MGVGYSMHSRGAENLKDFASDLFPGMGMLRKFEDSVLRLRACESSGRECWLGSVAFLSSEPCVPARLF